MMKGALHLLVFIFLPLAYSAQNECKDLSCIVYLLGADPLTPKVASYIEEHGGHVWVVGGNNPENAKFTVSTSQPKNSDDKRFLIDRIYVRDQETASKVAKHYGYGSNYNELRKTNPAKYPKVKKKSNGKIISFGYDWEFDRLKGDFSDCWRGEMVYSRNASGDLVVSEIQFILFAKTEVAIKYNPVGWHTENIELVCETGDCVVCGVGKLEKLKGVSAKEVKYGSDVITIDVDSFENELPLGISRDVSYDQLLERFGKDYPWTAENTYAYHTSNGDIQFVFKDNRLDKIISQKYLTCVNYSPVQLSIKDTLVDGCETANHPGIVAYTNGYTYYGERLNGLPHGIGAKTRPPINDPYNGMRKAIYGNLFENGKCVGYTKQLVPICLSGDCTTKGIMLTSLGIYEGAIKSGLPHGDGTLRYTYDITWDFYKGNFENGYPKAENGRIDFFDGGYYQGGIANGKPNGNGTEYDKYGKKWVEGWFEDGFRKGPKRVTTVQEPSQYEFDPVKQNWRKTYLPAIVKSLNFIDSIGAFSNIGDNFYKGASYCVKYESNITSVTYLSNCLRENYSLTSSSLSKATNMATNQWTELYKSFATTNCNDEDVVHALENAQSSFETFAFHAKNIPGYYEALRDQLKVPAVQKDLNLAKQMYRNGIGHFQQYYDQVDVYYSAFIKDLNALKKLLDEKDCGWSLGK